MQRIILSPQVISLWILRWSRKSFNNFVFWQYMYLVWSYNCQYPWIKYKNLPKMAVSHLWLCLCSNTKGGKHNTSKFNFIQGYPCTYIPLIVRLQPYQKRKMNSFEKGFEYLPCFIIYQHFDSLPFQFWWMNLMISTVKICLQLYFTVL